MDQQVYDPQCDLVYYYYGLYMTLYITWYRVLYIATCMCDLAHDLVCDFTRDSSVGGRQVGDG